MECEFCKKESYISCREMIKTIPNVFFVHLNRFDFDLQKGGRIKINTRLEFKDEINLYPYTKEALLLTGNKKKEKEYWYVLKGIVIHSGTMNGGHYYSFIKNDED